METISDIVVYENGEIELKISPLMWDTILWQQWLLQKNLKIKLLVR